MTLLLPLRPQQPARLPPSFPLRGRPAHREAHARPVEQDHGRVAARSYIVLEVGIALVRREWRRCSLPRSFDRLALCSCHGGVNDGGERWFRKVAALSAALARARVRRCLLRRLVCHPSSLRPCRFERAPRRESTIRSVCRLSLCRKGWLGYQPRSSFITHLGFKPGLNRAKNEKTG